MTQRQYQSNNLSTTAVDQALAATGATGTRSGTPQFTSSQAVAESLILRGPQTASASLTWAATTSTDATGYELTRDAVAFTTITPRTATAATDPGPLTQGSPATWALASVASNWRSAAATSATTPSCP